MYVQCMEGEVGKEGREKEGQEKKRRWMSVIS
jgi:hypothetical protein